MLPAPRPPLCRGRPAGRARPLQRQQGLRGDRRPGLPLLLLLAGCGRRRSRPCAPATSSAAATSRPGGCSPTWCAPSPPACRRSCGTRAGSGPGSTCSTRWRAICSWPSAWPPTRPRSRPPGTSARTRMSSWTAARIAEVAAERFGGGAWRPAASDLGARGADPAPVLRAGPPLARLAHAARRREQAVAWAIDGYRALLREHDTSWLIEQIRAYAAPDRVPRPIGAGAASPARAPSMPTPEPADVPIFVLCGGLGSRLGEVAAARPKPMLDIGEKPMLLHIMGWYARFGFRRFVLCTGHRSEVISGYFANFAALNSDFTVDLADRNITYHQPDQLPAWKVTVAFTGAAAMTGAQDRPGGRPLSGRRRSISASPTATASPTPISATSSASISPMTGSAPCWACIRPRSSAGWRCTRTAAPASPRSRAGPARSSMAASSSSAAASLDYLSDGRCLRAGARAAAAADRRRRSSPPTSMAASGPASTPCATARWCRACGKPAPRPGRAEGPSDAPDLAAPAGHAGAAGRAAAGPARLLRPLLLPRGAGRLGHRPRGSSRPTCPSPSAPAPCAGCTTRSARAPRPRSSPACRAPCTTSCSTCAPDSPTFGRHAAIELSAANRRLLVIPEGCAHGFLTAQDATLLLYMVSRGLRPGPRARRPLGRSGLRHLLAQRTSGDLAARRGDPRFRSRAPSGRLITRIANIPVEIYPRLIDIHSTWSVRLRRRRAMAIERRQAGGTPVGVVVITHRAREQLGQCLPPLLALAPAAARAGGQLLLAGRHGRDGGRAGRRDPGRAAPVVQPRPDARAGPPPAGHAGRGHAHARRLCLRRRLPRAPDRAGAVVARPRWPTGGRSRPRPAACWSGSGASSTTRPRAMSAAAGDWDRWGSYTRFCSNASAAWSNAALDRIGGFKPTLVSEETIAVAELLAAGRAGRLRRRGRGPACPSPRAGGRLPPPVRHRLQPPPLRLAAAGARGRRAARPALRQDRAGARGSRSARRSCRGSPALLAASWLGYRAGLLGPSTASGAGASG